MDTLLSKLEAGFKLESSDSTVDGRIMQLQEYKKLLGEVHALIAETKKSHEGGIVILETQKAKLVSEIAKLQIAHDATLAKHDKEIEARKDEHAHIQKDITAGAESRDSMDKQNQGLLGEYRTLTKQIAEARTQFSMDERKSKELVDAIKKGEDRVKALVSQEQKLTNTIEEKSKQLSTITSDIAVLQSRTK